MKLQEAYKKLDITPDISDEDLKSKYKELAKKYHPDLYKDDPNKFKEINEAHQVIQDHRNNPHKHQNPFHRANVNGDDVPFNIDFGEIFSNFQGFGGFGASPRQAKPVKLEATISFKENVLGSEQELSFKRQMKCSGCNGQGSFQIKNDCTACDGFGRITNNQQNMVFQSGCTKCYGRGVKKEKCKECNSKSYKEQDVKYKVNIPPGLSNPSVLNVQGAGNFIGVNGMFGEMYGDILLTVKIKPDPTLSLQNNDVICPIDITLLEALEGCKKTVPTTSHTGEQEIEIPPKSKNKEEIVINGMGVRGKGDQKVIMNVIYPDSVDKIIEMLKESK